MSGKRYNVGIIGYGWVAGAHIDTFKKIPGCEVVAVTSRELDRAKKKIREHGISNAAPYDDLKQFLKHDGLDIVVICTPHPNHPAETIAAAEAGKHIVIEKPVAIDRASLRKMVDAVKRAKVQTSVCFEVRWIGVFRNIKAMLSQGLLGNVTRHRRTFLGRVEQGLHSPPPAGLHKGKAWRRPAAKRGTRCGSMPGSRPWRAPTMVRSPTGLWP